MEYKRGYCNGTRFDEFMGSPEYKALCERLVRLLPSARPIAEQEMERGERSFLRGYRYNDDNQVAQRTASHMAGVPADVGDDLLVEFLVAGLLDSASADHWYTYEKEW